MDEVFGRKEMISPQELRTLSAKSDLAGFLQLGSHLGAIAVTTALMVWFRGTWLVVPAFLAQGVLINFLYAAQHEMSHWTVFRTKKLNEIFGRILGFILIYPRDFDQIQHFAHHRYTNIWGKDGELQRPHYSLASYLLWMLGPTYWYSRIRRVVRFSFGIVTENYIPDSRKPDVIREARWHLAGYVAIAVLSVVFQSWIAVLYWLAPMMLTKVVHQLQNTIEHLGLPHVDDISLNTRSTRTNAAMRWVCWQMQYHTAHHAFPGVPFWRLKALHRTIFTAKGRRPQEMTYLGFQSAVVRAFSEGRTEADYPDDRVWIGDDTDLSPSAPAAPDDPTGLKMEA